MHISSLNAKLKQEKCGASPTGTILSMYEDSSNSLPIYKYQHPRYKNQHPKALTTHDVLNQNDGFTSCRQRKSEIYKFHEQKHKLRYALETYFYVSKNLPRYLENVLHDGFLQLEPTTHGKIMFRDFEILCEEFGFTTSLYKMQKEIN